ncbi:sensor histidine kinase [Paenibacillus sp. CAA11]|uniref:sensor histidine kinase n=1 Tax=Paenibacillus sp. CAA11 TaxID=1532905 RepID=UPI000D3D0F48|nr:HAMP domain-containing sensor histidine kinase [Paenibacillus sp. CAA11]AWB44327.1 sensor histidine kinase [Paenibacillus sp. CAA11]
MKIHRRMTFHFTYQLLLSAVFMAIVLIVIFFVILQKVSNDDLRKNFPVGALDMIVTETLVDGNDVHLPSYWRTTLDNREMWLQIVNMEGDVILEAGKAGVNFPHKYSVREMLDIQEKKQRGSYQIESQLDTSSQKPVLFLLGYESSTQELVNSWFSEYQNKGLVREDRQGALERALEASEAYIHVIDTQGTIVQRLGHLEDQEDQNKKVYHPLEIIAMQNQPGNYDTSIAVHRDLSSGKTWIAHFPRLENEESQPIMQNLIWFLVGIGAAMFLIILSVTIWHGYRYGGPLLLFSGWFERMGQGRYDEVFTEKDKKRVFRKNGKLRIKYRLYREAIHSFYAMAHKLAEIERERKRLDQSREEWMSGISHDLRTPLASIQGYGYMLEKSPGEWSREELEEMGTVIRQKSDYMLSMISDFSLFLKLRSVDEAYSRRERLELGELVRRAVLKYVNDATIGHAEFDYQESNKEIWLLADPNGIKRLMDNLLSNSIKHNPDGVQVTVSTGIASQNAFIRVADNGSGMDEMTKDNLFERYYRGTNTSESTEGSGLGMSIAKAIVQAAGGSIRVESELGRGTEITVLLPLEPPAFKESKSEPA